MNGTPIFKLITDLTLWAFQLTLDPTKPLDEMAFINGSFKPCSILFQTRIPQARHRGFYDSEKPLNGILTRDGAKG